MVELVNAGQGSDRAVGGEHAGSAPSATRADIERKAWTAVQHDFHAVSRTHIVWCSAIGRGAVKGFGDAADEARMSFLCSMTEVLDAAAPGDLARWARNLESDRADRAREAQVKSLAARDRMGDYSLGIDPTQTERLAEGRGGVPSNDRIVEALSRGLALVRSASRDMTLEQLREAVGSTERKLREGRRDTGASPVYRTVRMDAEMHARLKLTAHELGVKLQELCRHLLEREQGSQAARSTSAAFDDRASGASPFSTLDSGMFAAVALAARMPKGVLAAIRDGHVVGLPEIVAARIGAALPHPRPANDIIAHAASGARLPPAMAAKARKKPVARAGGMSIQEVALASGMSQDEIARMLAE